METLGSYAPKVGSNMKEIRLRFSRVKFWLGANAKLTGPATKGIALSGLIPPPPPAFGRRTQGHYDMLKRMSKTQQDLNNAAAEEFLQEGRRQGVHVA